MKNLLRVILANENSSSIYIRVNVFEKEIVFNETTDIYLTVTGRKELKAGQPVPEHLIGQPRADIGHVKGHTWERRLAKHKKRGSTREEIIEAENNPKLYTLEERSSNRSRKLD